MFTSIHRSVYDSECFLGVGLAKELINVRFRGVLYTVNVDPETVTVRAYFFWKGDHYNLNINPTAVVAIIETAASKAATCSVPR